MHSPFIEFIHDLNWPQIPTEVRAMARQCLPDLVGVGACGTQTELSREINEHALQHLACGRKQGSRLLFNGAEASPAGAALANGMTIDSVDAHDGYKPAKGHAGCGVLAAALALFDSEYDRY